eukprot:365657-Chlamydomonas_euryale.AAC.3
MQAFACACRRACAHAGAHVCKQACVCALPPGSFDTCASRLLFVIMLIRLDLPTLERPMTANSGSVGGGQSACFTVDLMYLLVCTLVWVACGSSSVSVGKSSPLSSTPSVSSGTPAEAEVPAASARSAWLAT